MRSPARPPRSARVRARRSPRRAVGGADDGQPPVAVGERRQRLDQDVVALARHDRADGQHLRAACRCRVARGAGSVPGSATVMRVRRHGEVRRPASARSRALVTTTRRGPRQRAPSRSVSSACARAPAPARLSRHERMVHQRDDAAQRSASIDARRAGRRRRARRPAAPPSGGVRGERPRRSRQVGRGRIGKAAAAAPGAARSMPSPAAARAGAGHSRSRRSAGRCRPGWRRRDARPRASRAFEPGARDVALVQRHADLGEALPSVAERAGPGGLGHRVEDVPAEEFGGGELARELRQLVEVLVASGSSVLPSTSSAAPMSTTTFCLVSVSRKKAASTTKVAPCRRCAGPKNGSGRLWAIMMWSRTSTAYIWRLSARSVSVSSGRPGRRACAPGARMRRQLARQRPQRRLAGDQHVERRRRPSSASATSSRRAVAPARPARGGTSPTWDETSRSRRLWKAPPSDAAPACRRTSSPRPPSPQARAAERRRQPGRAGAGVEHDVASPGACVRRRKAAPSASARPRRLGVDVDQRHLGARQARAASAATSSPTTPAPTTTMRSPGPAPASQTAFSAVSMLAASVARRGGHAVRHRQPASSPARRSGPGADAGRRPPARAAPPAPPRPARPRIAVFHREREGALPAAARACAPIRRAGTRPAKTSARCRG